MAEFTFYEPGRLSNSTFGGKIPFDNYRMKSLLALLGQGKLRKRNISKDINLDYSFINLPITTKSSLKISNIISYFPGYSRSEIESFFKDNCSKNIVFHKKVFLELIIALGYHQTINHISSFVSIYRLFEQIALSLPIVSLIARAQFPATFNDYKQLIDNKAKSDLSVLKKYSEKIMDSNYANTSISFNFQNTQNPTQNIELFKALIPQKEHSNVILAITNTAIDIKFKFIHKIIISFRNQFFHYLFNEKNIDYDHLEYPEEFLEVCNPIFINYFARFFIDLLNAELIIWG